MTCDNTGDINRTTSKGMITISRNSSDRITIGMCSQEKCLIFGSIATNLVVTGLVESYMPVTCELSRHTVTVP